MATTKLYLDTRSPKNDGSCPLVVTITHQRRASHYPIGLSLAPDCWDSKSCRIIKLPNQAALNNLVLRRKLDIDTLLLKWNGDGSLTGCTVTDIKKRIYREEHPDQAAPDFAKCFEDFAALKSPSTAAVYRFTLSRITAYCPSIGRLYFSDITPKWLEGFEAWLAKTNTKNARNIHLRNIRAVFNYAIDNDITTVYPFRKFKIRPVATRKRSLSADDLRRLFGASVEPWQRFYVDMFKLIFFLIGINTVDLHRLKRVTAEGRIEYERAKTHRLYSVKVEPEAMEIIERYQGAKGLVSVADRWSDHRNFRHQINKALQAVGEVTRSGLGGKKAVTPMFPGITTYWARHSWATIAASLDIPKETIAHALGHGSNTVTDIYIDFDAAKVDAANRAVIDWVLYGRRPL